ncbi:UNKNOWN [Stylonychia lemnae]|uniref:Transmembrane protein n=1 Tax=Stylonychia lemnae TaxID=5949 RepID=A0A078ARK7_STYLE|nr:UNKNOWN [Stylonychia lemnae]|eukprot:CDW83483.1 UNKNOWN [Stylonychia lemnae]
MDMNNQLQFTTPETQNLDTQLYQLKGHLVLNYGFFMFIFYTAQVFGMYFWSNRVNQNNFKYLIVLMIFVQAITILLISLKLSIMLNLLFRAIQGFFSCAIGLTKLSIDNYFNPRRDMQKVIDLSGLWYIGIAIGSSLTSFIVFQSQDINEDGMIMQSEDGEKYPYLFSSLINLALSVISIGVFFTFYPTFNESKIFYKKLQSTMFFQSTFLLAQNDFTGQITRHQRTRSTFSSSTLKLLIAQDKNLVFALLYQGLVYFVYFGMIDVFTLYCFTVLDVQNELFYSNIYSFAALILFVMQMFSIDLNYFENQEQNINRLNKHILNQFLTAFVAMILLYLLRFLSSSNIYLLMVFTGLIFGIFMAQVSRILSQINSMIDNLALRIGEEGDHVRNLSQFNANIAKILGAFLLCVCGSFNFWQNTNYQLGKNKLIYFKHFYRLCLRIYADYGSINTKFAFDQLL